jgi:selenocysteine-specific elongation factor
VSTPRRPKEPSLHLNAGSVLATAGHVDHGKSTLVRAITGTDPDRLAEEKARGLTIDLGFAGTRLPSGRRVSFVDVPGHVRFIRNMLAGAGAVSGCVFVVAATEGWKPQSEEHLRILDLLGVERGVIVLSMADRVGPGVLERRRDEVRSRVADTFLADSPILGVDSVSGHGFDRLLQALETMESEGTPAYDDHRPRLWVDRSFSVAGAGAVVTGTLTGGSLRLNQVLAAVPGGMRGRVRGLQSHQCGFESVGPGNRVAVNLTGVSHRQLRRGQALVVEDQWWPTQQLDARLTVLPGLDHAVSRRGAYQLHVGTSETPVRLRLLDHAELEPGGEGGVRLHLTGALALTPGDRFVLRESGRSETIGGGVVLDVSPVLPAARARPDGSVERLVDERGWIDAADLFRLTGVRRFPAVGRWIVSDAAQAEGAARLRELVAGAGTDGFDTALLDERLRTLADTLADLEIEGGRLHPLGAARAAEDGAHPWLHALDERPFDPPPPDGVDRVRLRRWVGEGTVVESDGVYFSAEAVSAGARTVARLLADHDAGVTASEVRSALGTSRKYVLPLLAHLDRSGITRRRGDLRVAGPRLPLVASPVEAERETRPAP